MLCAAETGRVEERHRQETVGNLLFPEEAPGRQKASGNGEQSLSPTPGTCRWVPGETSRKRPPVSGAGNSLPKGRKFCGYHPQEGWLRLDGTPVPVREAQGSR